MSSYHPGTKRRLFSESDQGQVVVREADNINPYLVPAATVFVRPSPEPQSAIAEMSFGSMPNDGGHLLLNAAEAADAIENRQVDPSFIRPFIGSQEFIRGLERRCVWVGECEYEADRKNGWLEARFDAVRKQRSASNRSTTRALASVPFRFGEVRQAGDETAIVVPAVSSENREYLPCGLLPCGSIVSNRCYALYDAPLWNMALIASRLHRVWIGTVCGRFEMRFSYSNTLGWNTFPLPRLTAKNRDDLTECAENILLAREAHFPATIADLYDSAKMPDNLRVAHERNDEILERIYIGRRFRNDTERLERLFEMYAKLADRGGSSPGIESQARVAKGDGRCDS